MSLTIKLYDLGTNLLSDISSITYARTMRRRLNLPWSFTVTCPAGNSLLTATAGDGYPKLRKGNRKLLVWEDGEIIFHGRVFTVERVGDGKQNLVNITAISPLVELGSDANDQAGRVVRGSTVQPTAGTPYGHYDGNFITPLFASSVVSQAAISGPDLILQVLTNSLNTGAESDPTPGEGPLPIDLTTGTFDLTCPPAVDLSVFDLMDWPMLVGDFITQLIATGVVDIYERPIDPTEGLDSYAMTALSAVSSWGTDRHSTVHFDYFTGSKNAGACRHVEDFGTINNKLYDYLGPRVSQTTWKANITPGSSGTTVDPTASRALYGGPHTDKGTFMSIRVLDTTGAESDSRPLFIALWNGEAGLRVEPRDMLFVTPQPGSKALYVPPADFDVGDLVTVKTGSDFGITLNETQRVYGYDKTWSREGVASISELITSADAE